MVPGRRGRPTQEVSDSREERFLQEIIAHPKDDLLRLAFADWLEEGRPNDDDPDRATVKAESEQANADRARAEFIRVQLGLTNGTDEYGNVPTDAEREETQQRLEGREDALLPAERGQWAEALQECGVEYMEEVEFRRGLPYHVTIPAQAFLDHAEQLFALAPIQSVCLTRIRGETQLQALAASPHLARLTTLALWGNHIDDDGVAILARSPRLANLTALDLGANLIGSRGAVALANSPHLARLTTLALWGNHIGNDGAASLADSEHLARLSRLYLAGNVINDAGAHSLAASPHLASLTTLDLRNNRIGSAGMEALATSPHLGNLTSLDLDGNNIPRPVLESVQQIMTARRQPRAGSSG